MICKSKFTVKQGPKRVVEPKVKWWKLKDTERRNTFRRDVVEKLEGRTNILENWSDITKDFEETAKKVLGVTRGGMRHSRETWWWRDDVQESIKGKKDAKKRYDQSGNQVDREVYIQKRNEAKRTVARAKEEAYADLYDKLDSREGEKDLYRIAKQRDKASKDIRQVKVIKDVDGKLLTDGIEVLQRWKRYFEDLMNTENPRELREHGVELVAGDVAQIGKREVEKALKKMKSGKAVGPDNIPIEAWKCLGAQGVETLTTLFNEILLSEKMPSEWRRSILVPVYKNKGDAQDCGNYRGIKLMSHTMKLWERVIDTRLRQEINICEQQYGFMPGKSTTDALFALRMLMEKYREGQRELHCVFVDLEKAYDRVPREELWHCMRRSGATEKYVKLVKDMYGNSLTAIRTAAGLTEWFEVKVGLHQGSALSPFLFAIVMDTLTEDVRRDAPWNMLFADDIVLCCDTRDEAEEQLADWREVLEKRGMRVSRAKTEYLVLNGKEEDSIKMDGEKVKRVECFKYLGSTVQNNGDCDKEIKKRVQAGWNGWRKVTGVMCDKKLSARVKGKIYKTAVRPALLYGLETIATTKKQEAKLEVAELRMLRWSLGVTRMDMIPNVTIREEVNVARFSEKQRETRLRWFGHVMRRGEDYIGQRLMNMTVPGKRKRGRPKRRYMDLLEEDMRAVGARREDTENRVGWRGLIRCGDP